MPADDGPVAAGDSVLYSTFSPDPGGVEVTDVGRRDSDLDVIDPMLAVVWTTGGGLISFTSPTGCFRNTLESLLEADCTGLDRRPAARRLHADRRCPAGLALSTDGGTPSEAHAVVSSGIDGLITTLERIEFDAPDQDCDCEIHVAVTDLGNNGTPIFWYLPFPGFDYDFWTITVRDAENDPPVLTVPPSPQTVQESQTLALPSSVDDPDAEDGRAADEHLGLGRLDQRRQRPGHAQRAQHPAGRPGVHG